VNVQSGRLDGALCSGIKSCSELLSQSSLGVIHLTKLLLLLMMMLMFCGSRLFIHRVFARPTHSLMGSALSQPRQLILTIRHQRNCHCRTSVTANNNTSRGVLLNPILKLIAPTQIIYKYRLMPKSTLKNYALMLPEGRRSEGNIAQLRDIIFSVGRG